MTKICPKCKEKIHAEQEGMLCRLCGHYGNYESHELLRQSLNDRFRDAQNLVRSYLRKKMEKTNGD